MTSEQKGNEPQKKEIVFVEEEDKKRLDFSVFKLRSGHSSKHRGKHRSETKGKGIFAFFRKKGVRLHKRIED